MSSECSSEENMQSARLLLRTAVAEDVAAFIEYLRAFRDGGQAPQSTAHAQLISRLASIAGAHLTAIVEVDSAVFLGEGEMAVEDGKLVTKALENLPDALPRDGTKTSMKDIRQWAEWFKTLAATVVTDVGPVRKKRSEKQAKAPKPDKGVKQSKVSPAPVTSENPSKQRVKEVSLVTNLLCKPKKPGDELPKALVVWVDDVKDGHFGIVTTYDRDLRDVDNVLMTGLGSYSKSLKQSIHGSTIPTDRWFFHVEGSKEPEEIDLTEVRAYRFEAGKYHVPRSDILEDKVQQVVSAEMYGKMVEGAPQRQKVEEDMRAVQAENAQRKSETAKIHGKPQNAQAKKVKKANKVQVLEEQEALAKELESGKKRGRDAKMSDDDSAPGPSDKKRKPTASAVAKPVEVDSDADDENDSDSGDDGGEGETDSSNSGHDDENSTSSDS